MFLDRSVVWLLFFWLWAVPSSILLVRVTLSTWQEQGKEMQAPFHSLDAALHVYGTLCTSASTATWVELVHVRCVSHTVSARAGWGLWCIRIPISIVVLPPRPGRTPRMSHGRACNCAKCPAWSRWPPRIAVEYAIHACSSPCCINARLGVAGNPLQSERLQQCCSPPVQLRCKGIFDARVTLHGALHAAFVCNWRKMRQSAASCSAGMLA